MHEIKTLIVWFQSPLPSLPENWTDAELPAAVGPWDPPCRISWSPNCRVLRTSFFSCPVLCSSFPHYICCCSLAKSCLTLCDPMDYSTLGLPVPHSLEACPSSCPLNQWCHPTISPLKTTPQYDVCTQLTISVFRKPNKDTLNIPASSGHMLLVPK